MGCGFSNMEDSEAMLSMNMGLYGRNSAATAGMQDPCDLGLPEIVTVAHDLFYSVLSCYMQIYSSLFSSLLFCSIVFILLFSIVFAFVLFSSLLFSSLPFSSLFFCFPLFSSIRFYSIPCCVMLCYSIPAYCVFL